MQGGAVWIAVMEAVKSIGESIRPLLLRACHCSRLAGQVGEGRVVFQGIEIPEQHDGLVLMMPGDDPPGNEQGTLLAGILACLGLIPMGVENVKAASSSPVNQPDPNRDARVMVAPCARAGDFRRGREPEGACVTVVRLEAVRAIKNGGILPCPVAIVAAHSVKREIRQRGAQVGGLAVQSLLDRKS